MTGQRSTGPKAILIILIIPLQYSNIGSKHTDPVYIVINSLSQLALDFNTVPTLQTMKRRWKLTSNVAHNQ